MPPLSAGARVVVAVISIALLGCSSEPPAGPVGDDQRNSQAVQLDFAGALVSHGKAIHDLGRGLALALTSSEVRSWVRQELDNSPYVEHRIRMLQALMAASRSNPVSHIAQNAKRLAGAPIDFGALEELELYLPIPEHFQAWSAEQPVQVAVPVNRNGDYVIYSTDGSAQRAKGDHLPSTATLVLGPSEIDYDDVASAVRGGRYTGDMMASDVVPVRAPLAFSISTAQHSRITYFRTSENHDDFFGGTDEVEIWGGMNGPGWDPATPFRNCKRFTGISKNTNYVFPNDAARTIANAIPTGAPDKVRVDAWEDDNGACVLNRGDDDFYGFISLAIEQYGSIWATIRDSGAPGHISVRVEAGTP